MDGLTFELINQLGTLSNIRDLDIYVGETGEYDWIDITHPKAKALSDLATWVIFTDRGHVNQLGVRELRNNGYRVFQVEVDPNYGWVTAGIEIPDLGVLVVYNDNLNNRWRKGN